MIGVVIVTHGKIGAELVKATEIMIGGQQKCETVAVDNQTPDTLRNQIVKAIKAQEAGQGVLLLTDMFGGTPSNISLSFNEADKIEVLTGLNLPLLIKIFGLRNKGEMDLKTLALTALDYARKSINLASEMIKIRPK
ncbi:MAG: hypothetical protein LBE80_03355 [Deltaproteobacteria bacterium]|jgi:PTS system mannose-specific IIA component|nr:hypothetical protein [Deltaproteobacteria bacterium]